MEAVSTHPDGGAKLPLWRERFPDERASTVLALRLLAPAPARYADSVSRLAASVLHRGPADDVAAAVRHSFDDEVRTGFAMWLIHEGAWKRLSDAQRAEWVPPAALRLLSDPSPYVRATAIWGSARMPAPLAVPLLRRLLEGRVISPDGSVSADAPQDTEGNRYAVCSALTTLRDVESLPRMRELASTFGHPRDMEFEKCVAEMLRPPEEK